MILFGNAWHTVGVQHERTNPVSSVCGPEGDGIVCRSPLRLSLCILVVNSSRSSLGCIFLLSAGSLCSLCLLLLKSHLKSRVSISWSERVYFSLKAVCQAPFPFSYWWEKRLSLHLLSFVALPCHHLLSLLVLSIPLPVFCLLLKEKL